MATNTKKTPLKVKENLGYKIFLVINFLIMLFVVLVTLYPFVYLVSQSFTSEKAIIRGEAGIIPKGFNIDTYKYVLRGEFLHYYKNTIVYTLTGTILSLVFSSLLAYPMAKSELKFNRVLTPFIIFTMYFGGTLISNYILIVNGLNLKNTVAAFILPMMISTYYVILMKSFFQSIPKDLEEAGEIDGLSKFGVFIRICLPLSKPILATMTLFYSVMYWNNWYQAFLYLNKKQWPVAYYLQTIIRGVGAKEGDGDATSVSANIKSCAMVLTVLPIICVYPIIQKYYVQGMMLGGVKE